MKKLNQRGAIDFILIAVVFVLIAGFGGYVYYQQQQNNKTYNQASVGANVTTKEDNSVKILASASSYCMTKESADLYKNGTIKNKPIIYSEDKNFAMVNGACYKNEEAISSGGKFLLKLQDGTWSVIFTGQDDGFPAEIVSKYKVPAEDTFK